MLKIAICDDNVEVCRELKEMLLEFSQKLGEQLTIEEYYTAEQLWKVLQKEAGFDLVFLDIELPGDNGMRLAHRIRFERDDHFTQIVYISAKQQYKSAAFDVHPIHFLVKPLQKSEVWQTVQTVLKMKPSTVSLFQYTQDRLNKRIPVKQILYLTVMGKKLSLILTDGETIVCRMSMKEALSQLAGVGFIRISQSAAVNQYYVLRYNNSSVYLLGDVTLPISPRYKKSALQELRGVNA